MPLQEKLSSPRFAAVVLAAGASRRMGRAKALLPVGGKPLIVQVLQTCQDLDFISSIVVVTGHEARRIEAVLGQLEVKLIANPDFDSGGMISSVKVGLSAIAHDLDAVFIVLGDQPFVSLQTFDALRAAWCDSDALIVRPTFDDRHGHPILIAAHGSQQIVRLPADETLKDFVHQHRAQTVDVPVNDAAILHDVDTPADYARVLEAYARAERSLRWTEHQTTNAAVE